MKKTNKISDLPLVILQISFQYLEYGELESYRYTSKPNQASVASLLSKTAELPVSWARAIFISQLWQTIEQAKLSGSQSQRRGIFVTGGGVALFLGSFMTGWLVEERILNKVDSLLNICNQTNAIINNITSSCLSYLNNASSICFTKNLCDQLTCQIGNLTEISDCKAPYDDIEGTCGKLSIFNYAILASCVGFGMLSFLSFMNLRSQSPSNKLIDAIRYSRIDLERIIPSFKHINRIDESCINNIRKGLAKAYHESAGYSFFHEERLNGELENSEFSLVVNDEGYIKLPG